MLIFILYIYFLRLFNCAVINEVSVMFAQYNKVLRFLNKKLLLEVNILLKSLKLKYTVFLKLTYSMFEKWKNSTKIHIKGIVGTLTFELFVPSKGPLFCFEKKNYNGRESTVSLVFFSKILNIFSNILRNISSLEVVSPWIFKLLQYQ